MNRTNIVSRESKPRNSDFYQKEFCQRGNTKHMAHILSNSRSSVLALDQLEPP